ncbi:homeobox-DDT domain protein RLT3 isoform X2 [Telopea speciosissima]|uniref:homeobox-DDT domain protein RLT3 isoform X2 n=1 Tax=Telopea speciosissima TaxID=54955 RepID=UPI001CC7D17E|nr:homeobox-DDT domain protein RLT3 isoform X2 [Telopea speciosissima]
MVCAYYLGGDTPLASALTEFVLLYFVTTLMGDDGVVIMTQDHGTKRKTVHQLEALERLYSEDHYPTQKAMEDHAVTLKLTYKQVCGWFAQRRRREKRENRVCSLNKKCLISRNDCSMLSGRGKKIFKPDSLAQRVETSSFSKHNQLWLVKLDQFKKKQHKSCSSNRFVGRGDGRTQLLQLKNFMARSRNTKLNKKVYHLQDMLPPDYILKKVFRKDGPPLGVEFDTPPSGAFTRRRDARNSIPACQDSQKAPKGGKVSKPSIADSQVCKNKSLPVKKHGIGKGLMTVWRATNPDAGDFPTGLNFSSEAIDICSSLTLSNSQEPSNPVKRLQHQGLIRKRRRLVSCEKKETSVKRRKVERKKADKDENKKKALKADCKLALGWLSPEQDPSELVSRVDDEELELRELRAGPNPVTCSAHLATDGPHSCSLCKDLLAKFPPHSVKMKQPFCTHPWDSSPRLVKELFKVFRFLYTYAADMGLCPFTLDEFAQAFHDKDLLLLGKVHVALLKLLLSDVETELNNGFLRRMNKDCRFLVLLHSVEHLEFVVQFWSSSLNSLTWTEIMRQVLVAAGFGSKQGPLRRGALLQEGSPMDKYGLRPCTLKGELFSILSKQRNNGLKVSELAKALRISELNLASTTDELERLICSTLSSDITLFEKISTSAYRLRVNPLIKKEGDFQPNTEDSGSVDDSGESTSNSSADDSDESESDSAAENLSLVKYKGCRKRKSNILTVYTEIDESHSGEVWVLGLMDGEYSDLSIEEKLNALVALVDLMSSGSSIRMEGPVKSVRKSIPEIWHHGSGAKIKRSSAKQQNLLMSVRGHFGPLHRMKGTSVSPEFFPVDSSAPISRAIGKENDFLGVNGSQTKYAEATEELGSVVHPLQSVYLGSDRRYNRYWLFLGPCDAKDPGHRRVYFESSEDGHWEVIDTKEGLYSLLSVLDGRGTREAQLIASLEKREAFLCQAMTNKGESGNETRQSTQSDLSEIDIVSLEGSSPVSYIDHNLCLPETANHSPASSAALVMELGKKGEEQKEKWNRLQAFDAWIWDSFYSNLNAVKQGKRSFLDSLARCYSCHDLYWRDERHCKICHTTFELDFDLEERYTIHVATCREQDTDKFPKHKVLSSQLQSLKAAIHAIEAVMPEDAFVCGWKRSAQKLWVKRLRRTSSMPEFLQVLTDFVGAINEDWLNKCCFGLGSNTALDEVIVFFPTMPQTTSAIALWLVKLDALITPHLEKMNSKKALENSTTTAKGRPAPR